LSYRIFSSDFQSLSFPSSACCPPLCFPDFLQFVFLSDNVFLVMYQVPSGPYGPSQIPPNFLSLRYPHPFFSFLSLDLLKVVQRVVLFFTQLPPTIRPHRWSTPITGHLPLTLFFSSINFSLGSGLSWLRVLIGHRSIHPFFFSPTLFIYPS